MDDFSNMSVPVTPVPGLVPFHPDAKGLTIPHAGMFEVVLKVDQCDQGNSIILLIFTLLHHYRSA